MSSKTKPLSLFHLIRPANTSLKKPPVIFMLHGYGSNEEDLFSFAQELPQEFCIISVRAPHTLMPYGYAWYAIHFDAADGKWSDDKQAIASRDQIKTFILEAVDAYNLDAEKVTMLGFSQGTILSYAVALTYPKVVKNIIGLSGYINESILKTAREKNEYAHLAVYASHGSVDQTISVAWARKIPSVLKELEITYEYQEFPVGHGVSPHNFYAFRNWLLKHS